MQIKSREFGDNERIHEKYTCDGENINPPLEITDVPKKSESLVLIVDDPDAPRGTFVHWVLWNIPPYTKEIKEDSVPDKAVQGKNDFGKNSYGGPCPPSGTHRYRFRLYALDKTLELDPDTTEIEELERAMAGHIIAQSTLVGLYSRNK